MIAAPSSSGKTSFAQRLSIHLKVNNLQPVSISLDDYFVDREETPLDEFGNYNFESIYAINLEQFNKDLSDLLEGKEVTIPKFNFKKGRSEKGKKLKINKNQPIILEGIHGLNPLLTSSIPDKNKFKIYLSVLTQLNLDEHNRIPTTDLRLIRRIVRDNQFRSYSALHTLKMWDSVNRGEEKNIFPYQELANTIFNTSLIYELNALKPIAMPLLQEITDEYREYAEAQRLINILKYFREVKPFVSDYIDNTRWWKIEINPTTMCGYTMPYLGYINSLNYTMYSDAVMQSYKYRHYLFGVKYDEYNKRQYYIYAVPGKKAEQPDKGHTGFTRYQPCDTRNTSLGYWLCFVDCKARKIVK